MFVAIDRISKFAFVQLAKKANRVTASAFLIALIAAVPYEIHTVSTDNSIEHRFTKSNRPWSNGQVERMNRTIKDATVQRYHYDNHEQFKRYLDNFVAAYNFARRMKTLKGLTPYEFIYNQWTIEPEPFNFTPIHQMPRLNN